MIKVAEQAVAVCTQSLGEVDHVFESGSQDTGDPGSKGLACGPFRRNSPEPTEILLEEICLKKWSIEVFNPLEVRGRMVEFLASFEKEKTAALQDFSVITVQLAI